MIEIRDELQKEALEENCAVKYQAYKRLKSTITRQNYIRKIHPYQQPGEMLMTT
jgi:hypothetical protein